ncbi:DUF262 domain-containing protein [Aliirhizobium cellulosilyticum]|uniref:DUF262 domain-containing protein n=1 Tax=Aliirhizobium cellulosilyticum TaxID=393664 RepID=A0A7W6WQE3_9HYPH|nr:DUF262 domain-containing protein [Rhizobium cellulosilyticum]MBB4349323.1 hypothetical protein [Rhizobium cellulosilyticum]MBB4412455.1 hypothetical protein [Rhizobium cellulosilyticum]MBB4447087.1 hypothetical protein [Rhizobium cellulosilyticum]
MITASEQTVYDVLGDRYLHEIPPYQRPYAWTEEEAQQLLVDLLEAMDANYDEPYFLGSIVLIKPEGETVGQVVDGQQRLTTLTILGAVLRDLAVIPNEKNALDSIVYIRPNPFLNQKEAVRVRAHEDDRLFFRESIQTPDATAKSEPSGTPKTEAQAHMWKNAQALRKMVSELNEQRRQGLVGFLLKRCVLVVVTTESRAAALRIFKVLNDRGLDLSNADVIKAELLAKFPDQDEMRFQARRWREYENDLGRQEFESLLETLRFIREERKNTQTLSDAYSARFKNADAKGVREFFESELAPAKEQYARLLEKDVSKLPSDVQAAAAEALAGLELVPNKDWVPVALASFMTLKPAELITTLERLEGLAWAMQLARRYDTQRMGRYVDVLKALRTDHSLLGASLTLTTEEAAEANDALQGALYAKFPTRVVRAMLERLDRLLAEQPVEWTGQKTVEHILPQNPNAGWEHFGEEQRLLVTHSLGNLVLLTSRKNSGASNLPYAEKLKVYFGLGQTASTKKRATYASAQELAHVTTWTAEAFKERHARHVTLLRKRWGL